MPSLLAKRGVPKVSEKKERQRRQAEAAEERRMEEELEAWRCEDAAKLLVHIMDLRAG